MRRWVFKAVAASSLLLCLAMAGILARSFWFVDELWLPKYGVDTEVLDGRVAVFRLGPGRPDRSGWAFRSHENKPQSSWYAEHLTSRQRTEFRFAGLRLAHDVSGRIEWMIVPLWIPMVALALPIPLWLSYIISRRTRSRSGFCKACGYNLTANTSGVCPECGTPTAPEVNA